MIEPQVEQDVENESFVSASNRKDRLKDRVQKCWVDLPCVKRLDLIGVELEDGFNKEE